MKLLLQSLSQVILFSCCLMISNSSGKESIFVFPQPPTNLEPQGSIHIEEFKRVIQYLRSSKLHTVVIAPKISPADFDASLSSQNNRSRSNKYTIIGVTEVIEFMKILGRPERVAAYDDAVNLVWFPLMDDNPTSQSVIGKLDFLGGRLVVRMGNGATSIDFVYSEQDTNWLKMRMFEWPD